MKITAYTDGACAGNPGPGGWAFVLQAYNSMDGSLLKSKELSGGDRYTTNNQMELMAVIQALDALVMPAVLTIYTDSKYVMDGATKWMQNWKANGWLTASKKPVANKELWECLDKLLLQHRVIFQWVKGHAGDPGNERADQLACEARDLMKETKAEELA